MVSAALRFGIAGFGWVARDFMAPAIARAGHALVAVADPGEAARQAASAIGGVRTFADAGAMLDAGGIDAVYVATPNDRHRAVVELAAARGVAVLCEKPLAASIGDAEAIAAAVRERGIVFRTAFDQRHHPAHVAARDAIAAGRIGTLCAIRIVYACWLPAGWRAPGWVASGDGNWRADPVRAGGGALVDLAPHGLDLADFLAGSPIVAVTAITQRRVQNYAVDDGAMVTATTASGVLLQLHVAYNCPETLPRRRLEVIGTEGMIIGTDTMGQDPGGSLTVLPAVDGGVLERIGFDGDASPFTEQVRAFADAVLAREDAGAGLARDLAALRLLYEAASEDARRCR